MVISFRLFGEKKALEGTAYYLKRNQYLKYFGRTDSIFERTDGQMRGRTDGQKEMNIVAKCTNERVNVRTDERVNGRKNKRTKERADERTNLVLNAKKSSRRYGILS